MSWRFSFFREISFAAFLISGILGPVNYYKSGNLDLKTAGVLSAGSFVGALAGVKINLLIPADTMKIILYLIVLLSGISILLRKDKPGNTEKKAVQSVPFYLVLGAEPVLSVLLPVQAGRCFNRFSLLDSGVHRSRYFPV